MYERDIVWDELNLRSFVQSIHIPPKLADKIAYELKSNQNPKFDGHYKQWKKSNYNVLKSRYQNIPNDPTYIRHNKINILADPIKGRYYARTDKKRDSKETLSNNNDPLLPMNRNNNAKEGESSLAFFLTEMNGDDDEQQVDNGIFDDEPQGKYSIIKTKVKSSKIKDLLNVKKNGNKLNKLQVPILQQQTRNEKIMSIKLDDNIKKKKIGVKLIDELSRNKIIYKRNNVKDSNEKMMKAIINPKTSGYGVKKTIRSKSDDMKRATKPTNKTEKRDVANFIDAFQSNINEMEMKHNMESSSDWMMINDHHMDMIPEVETDRQQSYLMSLDTNSIVKKNTLKLNKNQLEKKSLQGTTSAPTILYKGLNGLERVDVEFSKKSNQRENNNPMNTIKLSPIQVNNSSTLTKNKLSNGKVDSSQGVAVSPTTKSHLKSPAKLIRNHNSPRLAYEQEDIDTKFQEMYMKQSEITTSSSNPMTQSSPKKKELHSNGTTTSSLSPYKYIGKTVKEQQILSLLFPTASSHEETSMGYDDPFISRQPFHDVFTATTTVCTTTTTTTATGNDIKKSKARYGRRPSIENLIVKLENIHSNPNLSHNYINKTSSLRDKPSPRRIPDLTVNIKNSNPSVVLMDPWSNGGNKKDAEDRVEMKSKDQTDSIDEDSFPMNAIYFKGSESPNISSYSPSHQVKYSCPARTDSQAMLLLKQARKLSSHFNNAELFVEKYKSLAQGSSVIK